jgi:hypothetical protein
MKSYYSFIATRAAGYEMDQRESPTCLHWNMFKNTEIMLHINGKFTMGKF